MNSQYAMEQVPDIMTKLLAKSSEGKVGWRVDEDPVLFERSEIVEAFWASVGTGIVASIEVSSAQLAFIISTSESPQKVLLEITFDRNTPRYGFDSPKEEDAYNTLIKLYESTRRLALDLDAKIDNVKNHLDSL